MRNITTQPRAPSFTDVAAIMTPHDGHATRLQESCICGLRRTTGITLMNTQREQNPDQLNAGPQNPDRPQREPQQPGKHDRDKKAPGRENEEEE
ncbi:hypothetical protein D3C81_1362540 [compost metagenome]